MFYDDLAHVRLLHLQGGGGMVLGCDFKDNINSFRKSVATLLILKNAIFMYVDAPPHAKKTSSF